MGICRSSVTPEGSDKDRKIAGAYWSVTLTKLVRAKLSWEPLRKVKDIVIWLRHESENLNTCACTSASLQAHTER